MGQEHQPHPVVCAPNPWFGVENPPFCPSGAEHPCGSTSGSVTTTRALCPWHTSHHECSRAALAGAGGLEKRKLFVPRRSGRSWAQDNEGLLEAAVPLPHRGNVPLTPPRQPQPHENTQARGTRTPRAGFQPGSGLGAPPWPLSLHQRGHRMLLVASGLLSPLPASRKSPRLWIVSLSSQSRGQARWAAGDTPGAPPAPSSVSAPVAGAESPASYSPHKGPILLWLRRAGVTGSDVAAPGAPSLKAGPWPKTPHCHEPFSLSFLV